MADIKFYSWQREGLGNAIQGVSASGRPEIELSVTINGGVAEKQFPIVGPCDVIGFSADMVIRTEPVHWNTNFPPTLLAHIEFYDEDFLWRYSPEKAANGDSKLYPWLALIVLKEDEFTKEGQNAVPVPYITLTDKATLPPLSNNHLWAHVQELSMADPKNPDRIISRLLCKRPLDPNTPYHAFVVPVYKNETITERVNGTPITKTIITFAWTDPNPVTFAWTDPNPIKGFKLPIYYKWYFHTGNNEDFEYLADLLVVRDLNVMVGRKKIDCSQPGFGMPDYAKPFTLYLEGALKATNLPPVFDATTLANRTAFGTAIKSSLDKGIIVTNGSVDPEVSPPFYGQKHIGTTSLDIAAADPIWIHQLNRNPANRAAAGLGVQVFRKYQDKYMQKAWEQVESIVEANKIIETAVSTLAVSQSMYEKHFKPYRNTSNPLFVDSDKQPREPYISMALIAPVHVKTKAGSKILNSMEKEQGTLQYLLQKSNQNASMYGVAFRRATRKSGPFRKKLEQGRKSIDFDKLLFPTRENDFLIATAVVNDRPQFIENRTIKRGIIADEFTQIFDDKTTTITNNRTDSEIKWRESIEPRETIPALLDKMMTMPVANWFSDADNIKPALAYPDFEDPMYLKLIELSTEFLIPNLHLIPNNTVAVLLPNQAFIESFMVGLNVAMSSEMRWREYPTDERGSCFRQFWDMKGLLTEAQKADRTAAYKDITPIHTWKRPDYADDKNKLGNHARVGTDKLVLALRGDLFKCFPNASIYAIRANTDNSTINPGGDIKFPSFKAAVGADVKLLGFDLTKEDAKGTATNAGWFFILQETPGETRFGGPIPAPPASPSSSAGMASALYKKPVMIAIHAKEMLK